MKTNPSKNEELVAIEVLRHTFATHHLATFRSYTELQLEMGHRSAEQLRTRYIAMEGVYRRGESILAG